MLINPGVSNGKAALAIKSNLHGLAVLGFEKLSLASSIKITLGGA